MFDLQDGADCVTIEPLVNVVFNDMIENRDSPFVGSELWSQDVCSNWGMACGNFSKYVVEVVGLM